MKIDFKCPLIMIWLTLLMPTILYAQNEISGSEETAKNYQLIERINFPKNQNINNPVTVIYPVVLPPYAFKDENGKAQGLSIDLLRLWSEKTGTPIQFSSATWSDGLQVMRNGKADIHASLYFTEERDRYMDFAAVIASSYGAIFHHKSVLSIEPDDLRAYKVGAVRGGYTEKYLRENQAEAVLISYPEFPQMLAAMQKGDIRVFIAEQSATLYRLKERGLTNEIHYNGTRPLYRNNFWIAVRQGDKTLAQALDQGMTLITPEERYAIEKKWLGTTYTKTPDTLVIAMQNDFAPYTFLNAEGHPAGLFVDIWRLWEAKTGRKIGFHFTTWNETLNDLKAGIADIHSGLFYNDARAEWIDYGQPFYKSNSSLFFALGQDSCGNLADIDRKKIAVIKGSYQEAYVHEKYPAAQIIPFTALEMMVRAVQKGEASVCLSETLATQALITRLGLSGQFQSCHNLLQDTKFHAGVIKGDTDLLALVNDGFNAMNKAEMAVIEKRWVSATELQQYPLHSEQVPLTDQERNWLKAHPVITLGGGNFPPLDNYNKVTGRPEGIGADYTDLIGDLLGVEFKYISGDWSNIQRMAKEKQIDGIRILLRNKERETYLNFTQPYTSVQYAIFVKNQSNEPRSLKDLSYKQVGVMGDTYSHSYLKKHYPDIHVAPFKSIDGALLALISGELEAVVASLTVAGMAADRLFITGLEVAVTIPEMDNRLQIGIRKDWPQLVSILNKAIGAITPERHRAIKRRWTDFDPEDAQELVRLSRKEKDWLAQGIEVRVRVTNAEPYMFVIDGKPQGIAVDLLSLIRQRTGIKFHYVIPSPSFAEDLETMAQHEGPDLISSIMPAPERETFLLFTKAYASAPRFIFTRHDSEFVRGMEDLSGKTVAVVKAYSVHQYLEKNHPEIKLLIFKNIEDALKAVSASKAFAFIGDLKYAPLMITRLGLHNLKVAAPSSLPDHVQAMATRNDWPELRSILDKGLDSIPEEEKTAIINKWTSIKVAYGIRPADVLKWILIVVGAASGIVFLFVFWNRQLAGKVRKRTDEIRESRDYLKSLTDSMPDAVFSIKLPERKIEWANDTFEVLGYEAAECIGRTTEFLYPSRQDYLALGEAMAHAIAEGKEVLRLDQAMRKKSGDVFPADINISIFKVHGEVTRVTGIVRDISERRQRERRLQEYQDRLKALASQLTVAEESERRRIAADLHDHVGQALALARMQVAVTRKRVTDAPTSVQLDQISETLYEALQDTRQLMFDLSPPSLNELGLSAAIADWLEIQIEQRYNIETAFLDELDDHLENTIEESAQAILFRNVRELLINVVKHAQAKKVSVHLKNPRDRLKIIVEDDGIGFDPEVAPRLGSQEGGFGLFSIQERMDDLGGSLEIASEPGKGCKATLTVSVGEKR